jgi:hypothetical protein
MSETKLEEESALEKVSGSKGIAFATTLLAAFSGNPVASLLPVLTDTLASDRHKKRVEEAIKDISTVLDAHSEELKKISDAQYKIINETVLTLFQTIEREKLNYLRSIINNVITENEIESHEAVLLSRIIRDMSSEEMKFLIDNFEYKFVEVGGHYEFPDTLFLEEDSRKGLIANGLFGLGVLRRTDQKMKSGNLMCFSNIAAKLIALLKGKRT